MKKLTENQKRHIGETLTIRWGTSKGRDTYGYTTCSLRNQRGEKVAACNGGGYDMRGTVIGNWIAATFPKELCSLKPEDMPEQFHWQPDHTRVCTGKCHDEYITKLNNATEEEALTMKQERIPEPEEWTSICPKCGGDTRGSGDGQRINEGRAFYGLRFYDPNFDVLNAKLERADETFTKPEDIGKTFRQLQAEDKIVDLDVLRSWYKQTSPHATERHTRPTIDGACGETSVLQILNAIGLGLRKIHSTNKIDIYEITERTA
jgi:hypothetical protein